MSANEREPKPAVERWTASERWATWYGIDPTTWHLRGPVEVVRASDYDALEAERDALRARVAELEAELAEAKAPDFEAECDARDKFIAENEGLCRHARTDAEDALRVAFSAGATWQCDRAAQSREASDE